MRQGDQLTPGGRVPAFSSAADGSGLQRGMACETIDQGTLADTRRTEQAAGFPRLDEFPKRLDAGAGYIAEGDQASGNSGVATGIDPLRHDFGTDQVNLRQHDDQCEYNRDRTHIHARGGNGNERRQVTEDVEMR